MKLFYAHHGLCLLCLSEQLKMIVYYVETMARIMKFAQLLISKCLNNNIKLCVYSLLRTVVWNKLLLMGSFFANDAVLHSAFQQLSSNQYLVIHHKLIFSRCCLLKFLSIFFSLSLSLSIFFILHCCLVLFLKLKYEEKNRRDKRNGKNGWILSKKQWKHLATP